MTQEENQRTLSEKQTSDFIANHAIACGGNWVAMLESGLNNIGLNYDYLRNQYLQDDKPNWNEYFVDLWVLIRHL